MKYALPVLTVSLACLAGCATPPPPVPEPIGFRNITLGSAPQEDMKPVKVPRSGRSTASPQTEAEISQRYTLPNDSRTLGTLKIHQITYDYHNDKLYRISIDLSDPRQRRCPNADELVVALEAKYAVKMERIVDDEKAAKHLAQWSNAVSRLTYSCAATSRTNLILIEDPQTADDVDAQLASLRQSSGKKSSGKR